MTFNQNSAGAIYAYFVDRWGMFNYRRGWIKGDCPFCGKEKKFGVHITENRTNCFSCGHHPKPLWAIAELEHLSNYNEVWAYLKVFDGKAYDSFERIIDVEDKGIKIKPVLPESFKILGIGNSEMAKMAKEYMTRPVSEDGRGFNLSRLQVRGVGYCDKGEYLGCIIVPFYQGGKLIYFQARRFIQLGAKFKNPKVEDFGIGKNMLMYNRDALFIHNKVYIVESAFNAITIGDNGTGTLGKKISSPQFSTMLRCPAEQFVMILDPDAYKESIDACLKLIHYKKLKLVQLPEKEDVNSLGRKETMYHVKHTEWANRQTLIKMKNRL